MEIPIDQWTHGCANPARLRFRDEVNAFAWKGKLWVTTGMLRFVESDDELALVLGHELGHHFRIGSLKQDAEADADRTSRACRARTEPEERSCHRPTHRTSPI